MRRFSSTRQEYLVMAPIIEALDTVVELNARDCMFSIRPAEEALI